MERNNESWAGFKGELWKKEINVRDFIQNNYTPYTGDDSFLKPSSEKFLFIHVLPFREK